MTREQALDAWAAMTAEERLAMAETAPRVAEAWEGDADSWSSRRASTRSDCVLACIECVKFQTAWIDQFGPRDEASATLDEAKAKVDGRLVEEGWLLK